MAKQKPRTRSSSRKKGFVSLTSQSKPPKKKRPSPQAHDTSKSAASPKRSASRKRQRNAPPKHYVPADTYQRLFAPRIPATDIRVDSRVWDAVCKALPEDYRFPDEALIGKLLEKVKQVEQQGAAESDDDETDDSDDSDRLGLTTVAFSRPKRQSHDHFATDFQAPPEQVDKPLWAALDRNLPPNYVIPDPDLTMALLMDGIENTESVRYTRGRSVQTLFSGQWVSAGEEGVDPEVWETICQELPGDYILPDPELAEILEQYLPDTPAKLCIVILAHENEPVLADQVANIRKFNPRTTVVLYNGGTDPDFGQNAGVDAICPRSQPKRYDKMSDVLLDTMVWLEETDADYEYLMYLDSDAMFVNSGFEIWLDTAMRGYDWMGINIGEFPTPESARHWIPGRQMWEEWQHWQPIFKTDHFYGTLNGMQVYRRSLIQKMLAETDLPSLRKRLAETNVFAAEEIVYATLAKRCGGRHRPYPTEMNRFVRLGTPLNREETAAARTAPNTFFLHPVKRELDDPARRLLRNFQPVDWKGVMNLEDKVRVLNSKALLRKIIKALDEETPLSVVNIGATESYVMAQYTVLSEEEFMDHPEAHVANRGEKSGFFHRGIRFPNIQARDDAVEGLRKADIVGYNTLVRTMDGGLMTEKVFEAYGIQPRYIFEGYLRRVIMFSQKKLFHEMLRDREILLIGSKAEEARKALNRRLKKKLDFDIVGAIPIYEYEDVPEVKRQIDKHEFDLCLLAAGTSAVILAPYIAETHGKVAFDIGFGMESLITGKFFKDQWMTDLIGIDKLMKM